METVDFYFSFRSPYAWLAYYRIVHALRDPAVEFRRIPVFPPPNFPNDPAANPNKMAHLRTDIERMAKAYGLQVKWPAGVDTDWMRPHAAFLAAQDSGRGDPFALELFAARFSQAKDIGDNANLREAATRAGLDADAIVRAADDAEFQQRVMVGMGNALQAGIFGVPFFVYRGENFWGNDRLEWLLRAINTQLGRPVPELTADLLARPC